MKFLKPKLIRKAVGGPPRVVALYSDYVIGDIRLRPYLDALLVRGVIADYLPVDRGMKPVGRSRPFEFTHIWCQRNASTAQMRFLNRHASSPIVYDIDDLLTSPPEFVMQVKGRMLTRIARCVALARVVTTPTEPLARSLFEDLGRAAGKSLILRNGCANGVFAPPATPKKSVIWTSSDTPFFLREYPDFPDKLSALARRTGYEVVLIGAFKSEVVARFDGARVVHHLDFRAYRELLRFYSGALAIAPLPMALPAREQRFFDAKSDIKLVDYLDSGIVPVCSAAGPFASSPLAVPSLLAANGDEIIRILERCMASYPAVVEEVRAHLENGALAARNYWTLSEALDPLFV